MVAARVRLNGKCDDKIWDHRSQPGVNIVISQALAVRHGQRSLLSLTLLLLAFNIKCVNFIPPCFED